ncbi:glycosyltransferase family 87 protein [Actinoplanes utahensis]|uniref:GPI mannosyltransferase 1 n=1 Tax=Actinoplanes utahensis TaxID=1869 RepID=A0A0A6UH29_ACTUT|nr:glycosyltransferase 87 family protein [Actinoplanes utahensis]KHD74383.1 GPI mannosyltransferase 1 [Actinoplanes utahensis]GIF31024.1 membrane protein [Actinoplanes utahensis]
MSAQPPADRPDVSRATSDGFVRGLSQAIGGPLGAHAVPPESRPGRFWTAPRIVMALACLILAFSWVQKSPCMDGNWQNNVQYTRYCYTDVLALYYAEGLNEGKVPYKDHQVEYPVVTGYFMGVLGLPVHAYGEKNPDINQGSWFYNANALVLSLLAVISVAIVLALRRRRPWDAAILALSPIVLLTATINWDFLAIGLFAIGLLLWVRRHPLWAGVLFGLGAAAKLWPLFILGPILILALRTGRLRPFFGAFATTAVTWLLANLPVMVLWHESWLRFFRLNSERPIDWGTFWYIGRYFDGKWNSGAAGDQGPFQWLSDHVPTLNYLSYALFGLSCLAIMLLGLLAPRRPRLSQLAFLVVAAFLIFSKVWSQQYVLWLIPLIALARPKWGAVLAWTVAEIGYLAAFYAELMGAGGKSVIPEGTFVLASSLRLITVAVLCGLVVREIWRPELDDVRVTYGGIDPDAGPLDGPEHPWITGLRRFFGMGPSQEAPPPPVIPKDEPSPVPS